jgi:hypothetical protein
MGGHVRFAPVAPGVLRAQVRIWRRATQTTQMHGTSEHRREEWTALVPWRRSRLRNAGFDGPLAARIASDPRYDVPALLDLVERNCTPDLAARILAPLDAEPPA